MITSINLTLVIWVNLKKSSKFDENLDKKRFFGKKDTIQVFMWEKLIPKVKLRLNMYNSCLIQLLFTKKNNFFTKFSSNFELSIKFTQIKKVRFIDVIIPLRSVSTNVSNCIVLNFMYTKFQVSSSKKWQSYWYSNMVHLLLITLYIAIVKKNISGLWNVCCGLQLLSPQQYFHFSLGLPDLLQSTSLEGQANGV